MLLSTQTADSADLPSSLCAPCFSLLLCPMNSCPFGFSRLLSLSLPLRGTIGLLLGFPSVFSSVQSLSCVWFFATPRTTSRQDSLSFTISPSCLNSCPLSRWCHSTISSSVILFSSCLQSLPASGSFPKSQFFTIRWSKYWSFSFNISSSREYSGFISFGLTGWISLQSKGLSRVFSKTTLQKHQFFSFLYNPTLISIHDYWRNHSFD